MGKCKVKKGMKVTPKMSTSIFNVNAIYTAKKIIYKRKTKALSAHHMIEVEEIPDAEINAKLLDILPNV